jgi:putative hydrolase of HD superfamily
MNNTDSEEYNLSNKLFKIFEEIGIMKNLPRMGWQMRGIKNCESVADHSYRVVFISMILGEILKTEYKINIEKLLKIAILHDCSESGLTDLALKPVKLLGEQTKHKAEVQAMKNLFNEFEFKNYYLELWNEFEDINSNEGKIVRISDKMDMMFQAYEYEKNGVKSLKQFWENENNFNDYGFKIVKKIFDRLKKMREALFNGKNNCCS